MKNLKQTIPALILGLICVGTFAFADIKTQNPASGCVPPQCNPDTPVFTVDNQNKTGGLTTRFLGSTGKLDARDAFVVGVGIDTSYSVNGGLRVINGFSLFKDNVYISDPDSNPDSSINTDLDSSPTLPQYNLTLRPGSTTNLGMGGYCTTAVNTVSSGSEKCPEGSFVSSINPIATGADTLFTCKQLEPSTNPTSTGTCPTFGASIKRTYDGTGGSNAYQAFSCEYTVNLYNATYPATITIRKYSNYGYTSGSTNWNYETRTTNASSETFGVAAGGAGQYSCNNLNTTRYSAEVRDSSNRVVRTNWVQ